MCRPYSEPEYVRQVYALGLFYNTALVALETNFSTYPVMKLQELGYPNQYSREREDTYTRQVTRSYGFRTDRDSRPRAIAGLVVYFYTEEKDLSKWILVVACVFKFAELALRILKI